MKSWSSDIITLIPRAVVCLLAALPPLHALAQADANWVRSTRMLDSTGVRRAVAVEDDAAPLLYEGAIDVPSTDGTPLRLAYDARGALTGDATRGVCLVEYDLPGWPRRVQFADGSVTEFVYGASGTKLRTVHLTAVPGIAVAMGERRELLPAETLAADTTDYAGAVTLRNGVPVRVDFEGGYCSIESPGSGTGTGGTGQQQIRFHYYTPDHLGNIREVVGGDGALEQVTDYYPFGTPYYDGTGPQPLATDKEVRRERTRPDPRLRQLRLRGEGLQPAARRVGQDGPHVREIL